MPQHTQTSIEKEEDITPHHDSLESRTVYAIVAQEGEAELNRPYQSIIWSSIAAGLAITFSVIFKAALQASLPDIAGRSLIANLGYTSGFVIVILCRLQLFTENTITPVLPVLQKQSISIFYQMLRFWGVCFGGNMVGALLMAAALLHLPIITSDTQTEIHILATHLVSISSVESFARAIPAGFLVAALVWMLPSAKGSELWVIILITYMIALGEFTHVVAASVELFYVALKGDSGWISVITGNLFPILFGNILGGTGLFALIAWAQVKAEFEKDQ